jgi:hypothetical protein
MAAVEEAWQKKIESKSNTQLILQARTASLSLASRRAGAAAKAGTTTTTSAPDSTSDGAAVPPSPSIDERKQRIERLKAERMEMKQRLENSRNGAPSRRGCSAREKKSLRWADDAGDQLTVASNYLVSSGDRIPLSVVPPPLPESPAPTQLPTRFLDAAPPSALVIVEDI